jgi:cytochrome c-type biogenesis protein CcmH/NrfG
MNSELINDLASKEAFFERATALHGENRLDEAESLYRAILKVDPADIGSLHNLAALCIQQRRGQEAVELLREILHR